MQDERYSKYIGRQAIVPMTFGRHVPIISDKVESILVIELWYSSESSPVNTRLLSPELNDFIA